MRTISGGHLPYKAVLYGLCFLKGMFIVFRMVWPIMLVVTANTIYNICAKSTPEDINAFASLSITYFIAALCAVAMFFITGNQKNLAIELAKANWTSYALGIAIVGLEFGFICIYRAGWAISTGNLVASITLACVLIAVGVILYKETISFRQMLGIAVCAIGLIMITK